MEIGGKFPTRKGEIADLERDSERDILAHEIVRFVCDEQANTLNTERKKIMMEEYINI